MGFSASSQLAPMTLGDRASMTLTSLITLNAILGALVAYGILWLLAAGIRADADARRTRERAPAGPRSRTEPDRIAA